MENLKKRLFIGFQMGRAPELNQTVMKTMFQLDGYENAIPNWTVNAFAYYIPKYSFLSIILF